MPKFPLESISTAKPESFTYTPPSTAFGATCILVKVALDTAQPNTVQSVMRGLRRANPFARILLIEGTGTTEQTAQLFQPFTQFFDDNTRTADTDDLIMTEYPIPDSSDEETITAPGYLSEYECCINLGHISDLQNILTHTQPKPDIKTIYRTLSPYFHGGIIATPQKVFWGNNLLALEQTAYRSTNQPLPDYLNTI